MKLRATARRGNHGGAADARRALRVAVCQFAMSRVAAAKSLSVLLACALAATARAVWAQDSEITATALFNEGRRLANQGRYNEACPKFAESQRLAPSGGTLMNLAECYERTGRTASA